MLRACAYIVPRHTEIVLWRRFISRTTRLPYTREQQFQLLDILNRSNERELKRYPIGPSNVLRILHHRDEHGAFQSMDDVLDIKGLNIKGMLRMCESVLFGTMPAKRLDRTQIIPVVTEQRLKKVNSAVAVDISPPFITWIYMTRDYEVLKWRRTLYLSEVQAGSRLHTTELYASVERVLAEFPTEAGIFVSEQIRARAGRTTAAESNFSRTQLATLSMLTGLFSYGRDTQPMVVSLKNTAVSQMFKLTVGKERIGGQKVTTTLMQEEVVRVPEVLRENFLNDSNVNREYLSNVLLLATCFVRILRDETT